MPEIDGFETMERIRALPEGKEVPIVVITASPEMDLEAKVAEVGGDAVYHKPISMAILSEAIDRYLNRGDTAPLAAEGSNYGDIGCTVQRLEGLSDEYEWLKRENHRPADRR